MIYEDDKFLIFFNECDKSYIKELINTIRNRMGKITRFFNIGFDKKTIIRLYDKVEPYKEVLEVEFKRQGSDRIYHEWMIANTEDGCINMLSLDLVHEIEGFENLSEKEFCLNACHEFVHLCQQQAKSLSPGWFWEALACKLGNPECQKETSEYFTYEDLEERFDEIDGYGAAFKVANYLFDKYDNEFILELVKDEGKLKKVMDEYFHR